MKQQAEQERFYGGALASDGSSQRTDALHRMSAVGNDHRKSTVM